jgi:hypothetical protein
MVETLENTAKQDAAENASSLLVCLPFATVEEMSAVRDALHASLPQQQLLLAAPGFAETEHNNHGVIDLNYPYASQRDGSWLLTASDYLTASQLAIDRRTTATLMLGAEATSLSSMALQELAATILSGNADFAVPRYDTGPHDALVSSALLYPLTNALFGVSAHMPLPADSAFSLKMAHRLTSVVRRPGASQAEPLLWPVAEASLASLVVNEVPCGHRALPQPIGKDLNALLAEVIGSIFSDIEAKATFWQRARPIAITKPTPNASLPGADGNAMEDIADMVESFRNAYSNLQEIWSLVLPPQSLLRIKHIARAPAEEFLFPADLWARTAYDFVLAYHLRTINRGHLLGALMPIYLAWVASHIRVSAGSSVSAASQVEETASAFVAEKPYLVARWRWPDRFNP